jgi:hypothetical protein
MKTLAALIAVCALSFSLAGCLELDFSRVNGNQHGGEDAVDVAE